MPQHWEDRVHWAPWPLQPPPLHWPDEQVNVPQHWLELLHAAPWAWHREPPPQTPPEQVSRPQH